MVLRLALPVVMTRVSQSASSERIFPPDLSTRNISRAAFRGFGRCIKTRAAQHPSKCVIGKLKLLRVPQAKFHIDGQSFGTFPGFFEQETAGIDPDDLAVGSNRLS